MSSMVNYDMAKYVLHLGRFFLFYRLLLFRIMSLEIMRIGAFRVAR